MAIRFHRSAGLGVDAETAVVGLAEPEQEETAVVADRGETLDALVLRRERRVELLGGDQPVLVVVLLDERVGIPAIRASSTTTNSRPPAGSAARSS